MTYAQHLTLHCQMTNVGHMTNMQRNLPIGTRVTVPAVTSRGTRWPTEGIVCGYGRTTIQVHFPEIASTRLYAAKLVKPIK